MLDLKENLIDFKNSFSLKKTYENEDYFDYEIIKDFEKIGIIQVVNNKDSIFIRQISIDKEYRHNHYATKLVNSLIEESCKDISFCVSLHSESAIAFWKEFLKNKDYENPKGVTYIIKNKKNKK